MVESFRKIVDIDQEEEGSENSSLGQAYGDGSFFGSVAGYFPFAIWFLDVDYLGSVF